MIPFPEAFSGQSSLPEEQALAKPCKLAAWCEQVLVPKFAWLEDRGLSHVCKNQITLLN